MPVPIADAHGARLPAAGLDALAPLRTRPGVTAVLAGDSAWVEWPPGDADVVRLLMPVAGVRFFTRRGGHWLPLGGRLPDFDQPPAGEARPLDRVVIPARIEPVSPPTAVGPPVPLRVVP